MVMHLGALKKIAVCIIRDAMTKAENFRRTHQRPKRTVRSIEVRKTGPNRVRGPSEDGNSIAQRP